MQLLIQEFASRVALVLQEVDQALNKYWALRHDLNNGDSCITYLSKLFYLTMGKVYGVIVKGSSSDA